MAYCNTFKFSVAFNASTAQMLIKEADKPKQAHDGV